MKHITTGEGAALFFASAADADQAQWLKRYGIHRPSFRTADGDLNPNSDIPVAGYNFYMDNIAATIGLEQFKHVADLIARYRANGRYYDEALRGISGVRLVKRLPDSVPSYWTYNLLVERRGDLIRKMKEKGIASQRLHVRNDVYSCFDAVRRGLPGVDEFDQHNLSIPCGWWVTDKNRQNIVGTLRDGW